LGKVPAVHLFATLPVYLIGSKVEGAPGQVPLLQHPSSLVKQALLNMLIEVFDIGTDIESTVGVVARIDTRRLSFRFAFRLASPA
jgi:hypothetical protein